VVGQGQGAGLTARFVGQTGGEESVSLDFFNMGSHSHVFDPPHTLTTSAGQHSHQYSSHAIDLGRSVLEGYSYAFDSSVRAQWYETSMPHEFNEWFFSLSVGRHRHNFQVDGYTSETGGGQPHPNMPPYFVLAYIMRVQ
jgi:microcystin-dependent protein